MKEELFEALNKILTTELKEKIKDAIDNDLPSRASSLINELNSLEYFLDRLSDWVKN